MNKYSYEQLEMMVLYALSEHGMRRIHDSFEQGEKREPYWLLANARMEGWVQSDWDEEKVRALALLRETDKTVGRKILDEIRRLDIIDNTDSHWAETENAEEIVEHIVLKHGKELIEMEGLQP